MNTEDILKILDIVKEALEYHIKAEDRYCGIEGQADFYKEVKEKLGNIKP